MSVVDLLIILIFTALGVAMRCTINSTRDERDEYWLDIIMGMVKAYGDDPEMAAQRVIADLQKREQQTRGWRDRRLIRRQIRMWTRAQRSALDH